ncbi:hypothetical protein H0I76_09365 [Limibaculum sp. M0105]|uniref:Outer membrane protein assembly factor BamE n=1 Tax=Thermohalobaculum xanthum TaxID=2753746 RepID=A0A8J7M6W8_9RHOB|nr:hypothetical protein [Thermohalobaculum xanthum]MBK0399398.1 hypothetical protein [Thermohalobaculum xanthum]
MADRVKNAKTRNRLHAMRGPAIVRGCLAGAAALLLAGCEFNMEVGREVDLAALDGRLVAGTSTRADVLAALGEPFGEGRAMFPFHETPRDVLAYYYERGDLEDNRRTFLWVFVDDGRYGGHMWFSSLPEV